MFAHQLVVPTRVGMDRSSPASSPRWCRCPHACGDGPEVAVFKNRVWCCPHPRPNEKRGHRPRS